jgi:ankyrin repeat protein
MKAMNQQQLEWEILLSRATDGKSKLYLAAEHSLFDLAKSLLENGADPHEINNLNRTSFHAAAQVGCVPIMVLLMNQGVDPTPQDLFGCTALHLAACAGRTEAVRWLLKNVTFIEKGPGDTPLHMAANNGHLEVVRLLLRAKVDVNAMNSFGETPLYQATRNQYKAVAKLLLAKGAESVTTDLKVVKMMKDTQNMEGERFWKGRFKTDQEWQGVRNWVQTGLGSPGMPTDRGWSHLLTGEPR